QTVSARRAGRGDQAVAGSAAAEGGEWEGFGACAEAGQEAILTVPARDKMAKTSPKKAGKPARAGGKASAKATVAARKADAAAQVKEEAARGKLERVRVPQSSRREDGSEGKYV